MASGPASISFERYNPCWDFYAHCGRYKRVGHTGCILKGDRLLIGDLVVNDAYTTCWSKCDWIRATLGIPARKRNFRGRGIGTELLMKVVQEAQKAGIVEIYGSVVQEDLDSFPGLLDWYERFGFDVLEPDTECVGRAVKKVVLNL